MYLCLVSVNCDWERLTTLFVHEYEEVALRCCMQMEMSTIPQQGNARPCMEDFLV
jgi:hypothetical protein